MTHAAPAGAWPPPPAAAGARAPDRAAAPVVVRPLEGEPELVARFLALRPADGAPDDARRAYDERLLARALAAPGDARAFVACAGERAVARLVAFADDRVHEAGGRPIGRLGLFAAEDDPGAARALVEAAVAWLAAHPPARRPARVVAPMDGDTWHDYRLRTAGFEHPPLPGEPDNPPWHPALLEAAGLAPVARFTTRTVAGASVARAMARWAPARARARRLGFAFRRLGPAEAAEAIALAHPLAHRVFGDNPYFTPLDAAAFVERFAADLGLGLGPVPAPGAGLGGARTGARAAWQLVVAEDPSGAPAGLCLGFPDPSAPGTACLKSFGVAPRWRGTALGPALAHAAYEDWRALGADGFHHVLMREGGGADRLDRGAGVATRAYALYGRCIQGGDALGRAP